MSRLNANELISVWIMIKCVLLLTMVWLEIINISKDVILPVVSVQHVGFYLTFVTELYYLICYVVGYRGHFYRLVELLFKLSWNLNLFFYVASRFNHERTIVSSQIGLFTNIQLTECIQILPVVVSLLEMGAKKLRYDDFDVVWIFLGVAITYFVINKDDLVNVYEDENKLHTKVFTLIVSGIAMVALYFGIERYNGIPINPNSEYILNGANDVISNHNEEVAGNNVVGKQPVESSECECVVKKKDNGMKLRHKNTRYH